MLVERRRSVTGPPEYGPETRGGGDERVDTGGGEGVLVGGGLVGEGEVSDWYGPEREGGGS